MTALPLPPASYPREALRWVWRQEDIQAARREAKLPILSVLSCCRGKRRGAPSPFVNNEPEAQTPQAGFRNVVPVWPSLGISFNNIFSFLFPPSPCSPRNREGFVDFISLTFRKYWGMGPTGGKSSRACRDCVQGKGEACQGHRMLLFKC